MVRVMRPVSLLTFLLSIASFTLCLCNRNLNLPPCKENERQTLLMFKKDLTDSSNLLSSWAGEGDCCNWTGVVCDNLTGHVRGLHLAGNYDEETGEKHDLGGKVNPSLLNLKHLSYLDLSGNNFEGPQIPSFLGSLKSLRHLDLSDAGFNGTIPHQLGNLSSLRYLDISLNYGLMVKNLKWLSGLSLLKHLGMSHTKWYFSGRTNTSHWLHVNTFPSLLVELDLSRCELYHIPSGIANLTSLKVLDLSSNNINSTIPTWLYSLSHLESLNLSDNAFHGEISSSLRNLTALVDLQLAWNQLEGEIPNSLGNLCRLTFVDLWMNNFRGRVSEILESLSRCSYDQIDYLDFSNNNFSGHLSDKLGILKNLSSLDLSYNSISGLIPVSLGNLSRLQHLVIHHNSFEGVVSEAHFTNLTRLKIFTADENSLTLKTNHDWVPPFQLSTLSLGSWRLDPSELPAWLQSQKYLHSLNMSNSGISGTIPTWFWNIFSYGEGNLVDLSSNQLSGEVPNIVSANWPKPKQHSNFFSIGSGIVIHLRSNRFNGSLPLVSSVVFTLDLSNSSFSGTLSHFFCDRSDVPKNLRVLYLGNNLLNGEIPDCRLHWPELTIMNLEDNNVTRKIPSSIGDLLSLGSLHLRNNSLSGELPVSLQNCEQLLLLDLAENKFVGGIPIWFVQSLVVLSLRSNKFHGSIPDEICSLTSLQILDLAHNNFSGTIPRCFQNLSSMATKFSSEGITNINLSEVSFFDDSGRLMYFGQTTYIENAVFVTKGREVKYNTMLGLVASLDLSSNMLFGEIPEELTSLINLQTLNLSNNLLTGRIPSKIGDMGTLESLDLSVNQLSGEISPSISNLTFLDYLNLSYNNLIGQIPKSTQLQSFDQSTYVGNKLCRPPLEDRCSINAAMAPVGDEKQREGHLLEDGGFYLSLGLGFAFRFWIVLGSWLSNVPWSNAFSQFQNSIVKKLYAAIVERY